MSITRESLSYFYENYLCSSKNAMRPKNPPSLEEVVEAWESEKLVVNWHGTYGSIRFVENGITLLYIRWT